MRQASCDSHYRLVLVCDHFDCGYSNGKDWCGDVDAASFDFSPYLFIRILSYDLSGGKETPLKTVYRVG